MILTFIELPPFRKYIDSLENKIQILFEVQFELMANPDLGAVITGTGGLRKCRLAASGRGKRSGYRITYLHVPAASKIYLATIYAKNEKENLSEAEKAVLKRIVEQLKSEAK